MIGNKIFKFNFFDRRKYKKKKSMNQNLIHMPIYL